MLTLAEFNQKFPEFSEVEENIKNSFIDSTNHQLIIDSSSLNYREYRLYVCASNLYDKLLEWSELAKLTTHTQTPPNPEKTLRVNPYREHLNEIKKRRGLFFNPSPLP